MAEHWDVAVVGAGLGGLSSAMSLAAKGLKTVLIDALDEPGGRGSAYREDGYIFDRGPTIITAPFLFEDFFTQTGAKMSDYVNICPVDPFYRVAYEDGTHIDHLTSWPAFLKEIEKISPTDVEGVKAFFRKGHEIFKKGFVELGDHRFDGVPSMLKVAPDLISLNAVRSVYSYVSQYVRNEKVRQMLSFHPLLIGGNPMVAPAVYCLINVLERKWGVWHAVGGMAHLMQGFMKRFEELSGDVKLGHSVRSITKEGERFCLRMQSKDSRLGSVTITADKVVVNGDIAEFSTRILQGEARPQKLARRMKHALFSMSAQLLYFGCKRQWTDLPQHSIVLGPQYKGNIDDIFHHKVPTQEFSYYLHIPTRTDASLAPDGKEVVYILIPTPNLAGKGARILWSKTLEYNRKRVIRHAEEHFMPGLAESIEVEKQATPFTFHNDFEARYGNAFGLEPRLLQSAGFRPNNVSDEVDGLYFVGAGTQPGAGLPGVLLSARMTVSALMERHQSRPKDQESAAQAKPLASIRELVGALPKDAQVGEYGLRH